MNNIGVNVLDQPAKSSVNHPGIAVTAYTYPREFMCCPKGRSTDRPVSRDIEREGNVEVDISQRCLLPESLLSWTTVRQDEKHSYWRGVGH